LFKFGYQSHDFWGGIYLKLIAGNTAKIKGVKKVYLVVRDWDTIMY